MRVGMGGGHGLGMWTDRSDNWVRGCVDGAAVTAGWGAEWQDAMGATAVRSGEGARTAGE